MSDVDRRLDEVRGRLKAVTPWPFKSAETVFAEYLADDVEWLLGLVDELRRR